jgi:hypothetical protein
MGTLLRIPVSRCGRVAQTKAGGRNDEPCSIRAVRSLSLATDVAQQEARSIPLLVSFP